MTILQSAPIPLGRGYSIEFSYDEAGFNAVWSPRVPYGRHGRALLPAYREARHAFLIELSKLLGTTIVVADGGPEVAHG